MSKAEDKKLVKRLAGLGLSPEFIAKRINVSVEVLEKDYARELRVALPELQVMAGAHLYAQAVSGNLAAICFWLKTRAGWSETAERTAAEEAQQQQQQPEEDAPPPGPRVRMPCNARQGCPRASTMDIIEGIRRVRKYIINEMEKKNIQLPENLQRLHELDNA